MSGRYARLGSDKLGRGSYGYVYPAWDETTARLVAVKVQKRDSDTAVREMMFFQTIPYHKHLLRMLDLYIVGPELFLVFEYLYNSLSDVFHRAEGLLDACVAKDYSHQVLQGLDHLHVHDVAHRDLSMGNILIDIPTNTFKIADLGLAACASHFVMDRPITTLWYRAPEAVLGVEKFDFPQTVFDMWSYAVIMCALLSGTHVFCLSTAQLKPEGQQQIKILQKQIDLLGPPDWPGIKELPSWAAFAPQLKLKASGVSTDLSSKFLSKTVVRRLLQSTDISLLCELLRWDPASRLTAAQAKLHSAWTEFKCGRQESRSPGMVLPSTPIGVKTSVPAQGSSGQESAGSQGSSGQGSAGSAGDSSATSLPQTEEQKRGQRSGSSGQESAGSQGSSGQGSAGSAGVSAATSPPQTEGKKCCQCSANCGCYRCERRKRHNSRHNKSDTRSV